MKLSRSIRTIALATLAANAASPAAKAAVVAFQGFEGTTSDTWGYSVTGTGGTVSNVDPGTEFPAGSSRIRTGSFSFQQNATASATTGNPGQSGVVTFNPLTLTGTTASTVELRLAAMSKTSANGLDGGSVATGLGDFVQVFVALNGSAFSSTPDLVISGRSNAHWAYSATGVAEVAAGTPATFTPAAGGERTTDGYSRLLVDLPSTASSVAVKVITTNDNTGEIWAVDDVSVSTVPEPATLGLVAVGGVLGLARRRRARA